MATSAERSALVSGVLKAAVVSETRRVVRREVWLILKEQGHTRSLSDVGQSIDNVIDGGYAKEPTIGAIETYLFPEPAKGVTPIRRHRPPHQPKDLIPKGERESLAYALRFAAVAVRGEDLSGYRKRSIAIIPRTFGKPAPLKEGSTYGELEEWLEECFFPTMKRLGGVGRAYTGSRD